MMENKLELISVSEMAQQVEVPECDPLTEEVLAQIEKTMRKGLVLHRTLGIKRNERPLAVNVHPEVLLSLVQEVRRARKAS